jgi:serine/threonine protein kinase
MLVGLPPFYSKDRQKLYENIKTGTPKLDFPFLGEDAIDLCTKLLVKDPKNRLGSGESDALEIKNHPWF